MKTLAQTSVRPTSSLNLLSQHEIDGVTNANDDTFQLFRRCALAVLNTGNDCDDYSTFKAALDAFEIHIVPEPRGIRLDITNAPASAFVNNRMIRGIEEHLFSALRDIVYTHHKMSMGGRFDFDSGPGITDAVFRISRNAGVVKPNTSPKLVVCWGGHAVSRIEYEYAKSVGFELGLRGLNIATGCGTGAMKGPMKGAVIGHGKQQIRDGRYVGISEPGIIASESPNPTVNELVILPDIEKRLEAFVRLSHGIIVFPGGAGTAEEVLYLLGILMQPGNTTLPFPLIFAAPQESADYFRGLDAFICHTLGEAARQHYEIIVGSPEQVANSMYKGIESVTRHRRKHQQSYAFNWELMIPMDFQQPFKPTHKNMAGLKLNRSQSAHALAADLRRAFSAIVAGNVKADGIAEVKKHGPFQLSGDAEIAASIDNLLRGFVDQGRMKLNGQYTPCYEVVQADTST
ncbi:Pyrimidine/purine nucleotide 5'-monophosphate nucleosidase [BD1-7 clade bacterium]|uniref:AMP nucleosidase n=1 Tax=BD1-7 clade bacterium TaxID=2029982 RepID=A0A5S9Q6W7_9GAMM|nr:Pyrimidine/purine nucleotide 5'-monophosphate nucleosidase [BD1-7 clade bacterium]CAA0113105.1 Pyrimidine/purine nucleotide 5'-monophosphate nucleosidase [BD1-7 clade bacterium]